MQTVRKDVRAEALDGTGRTSVIFSALCDAATYRQSTAAARPWGERRGKKEKSDLRHPAGSLFENSY